MRLVTIGRSKSSTIYINNEYVSSNHAQLLLLDNGEIYLTDCGSRHGTFLNGVRIEPHIEVPVKKGDRIDIDQVPLNWGQVPSNPLPDPAVTKGVYGIGKAKRNRYILSGDSVSRYHATFKEMKNGKWFIVDHSTNGTYVNGQRIPSNADYRITNKDSIMCGTVPCPNPVPSSWLSGKLVAAAVAAVAAVVLIFFGLDRIWDDIIGTAKMDPSKATVMVTEFYNVEVEFEDDLSSDLKNILGVNKDWYLTQSGDLGGNADAFLFGHNGTAFFVSADGILFTNKHVTNALYADEHYSDNANISNYKLLVENWRQRVYSVFYPLVKNNAAYSLELSLWMKSAFKFKPANMRFGIRYPDRTYSHSSEFDWAHLVAEAERDDVDIAVIRLNSRKTPDFADYFRLDDAVTSISELSNKETYYTTGFPAGEVMATAISDNYYRLTNGKLHIAQTPGRYQIIMTGDQTIGGQSGSPIYDSKNRLIGILWGGMAVMEETTSACPIIHGIKLVNEYIEEDDTDKKYKSANYR